MSIDLDLTSFFDSLNTYLPVFMGVFGMIGGIIAALAFARYIVSLISGALSGQGRL
jgi:hypothetical protein